MYHEMRALQPASGIIPRYASVCVNDTEPATSNRKHFCSGLRESLLSQIAVMLEENNNLVNSFICMRNLIQSNGVSDDVKLVIHAHKKQFRGMFENIIYQKQVKLQL